jgi:hypothetical protein
MAFSGQSFPELQFGNRFNKTKVGVSWPTSVAANSAFEYRVLRYGYPRLSWQIPGRALTWQDKETLLSFWNGLGGSLLSFLFTDPEHNTLSDFVFGTGTLIAAPGAPTLAAASGTLAAAAYTYEVTAYNAVGETVGSTSASITLSATGGVAVNWSAVSGATGYKVYGRASGAIGLLADVGNVLTYTDSGAATPGAAPPATNGTGTTQFPSVIQIAGANHPLYHLDGLTITPSGATLQIVNGAPVIAFASAPAYGTNVVGNGPYALAARFDSSAGYALANAANPDTSAVQVDTIKLIEVFE